MIHCCFCFDAWSKSHKLKRKKFKQNSKSFSSLFPATHFHILSTRSVMLWLFAWPFFAVSFLLGICDIGRLKTKKPINSNQFFFSPVRSIFFDEKLFRMRHILARRQSLNVEQGSFSVTNLFVLWGKPLNYAIKYSLDLLHQIIMRTFERIMCTWCEKSHPNKI